MKPRCLFVLTYYPEFMDALYAREPGVAELGYESHLEHLLDTGFGVGDAYCRGLRKLGCEASVVIVNADRLQARWAIEHDVQTHGNIHDRRRQILAAQVNEDRPDVLYVFEWCPLGDAFLAQIKTQVGLLVGQIASPLPSNRTFAAYDLMISAWPPIVDHFRSKGIACEPLRLGFDPLALERISPEPPLYDVTFVGGFAPSHDDRIPWLEHLLQDLDVTIFGYGLERVPSASPIHNHYRGPAWGWEMYEAIQRSKITLNRHAIIEVGSPRDSCCAANMRLYEATGVGTCLVTDAKENLCEMFEPTREVVTYTNARDCVEKIQHYLTHERERKVVAEAGRRRTMRDHTYDARMCELLDYLVRYLPSRRKNLSR